MEKPDGFTRGSLPHVHPPHLGAATPTSISMAVKKMAAAEIFTSAVENGNKVTEVIIMCPMLYNIELD
jgi:hypothetical protein